MLLLTQVKMKILYRTPYLVDVFLDDDETPEHGWGKWSKFRIYNKRGEKKLIFLDGNPLSIEDFNSLLEQV